MIKQITLTLGLAPLLCVPASAIGFEVLTPHRAVYEIKLREAEDRSGIKGMSGRIVYEVQGNECEGISVKYRFVTKIQTDRAQFVTDQQTATYESADGNEFYFQTKSFVNEQADQVVQGNAVRGGDTINITISKPQERKVELDNAKFVSSHLIEIMKSAKAGENFVSQELFDGSGDADTLLSSASVIGKLRELNEVFAGENEEAAQQLEGQKAWPITLSYFRKIDKGSGEGKPIYTASFMLLENGITRKLQMKYPDYVLDAALTDLEMIKSKPCKIEN